MKSVYGLARGKKNVFFFIGIFKFLFERLWKKSEIMAVKNETISFLFCFLLTMLFPFNSLFLFLSYFPLILSLSLRPTESRVG